MVKLEVLGFNSLEEYIKYFFRTLLPSNRTYSYFVDWEKVKNKLEQLKYQISILNYLTQVKREDRRRELKQIITKYPEVVEAIPYLIAVREKDIEILEIVNNQVTFKKIIFDKEKIDNNKIEEIINFCEKTGLLDAFDNIKDLFTYLFGVEVGIDSNARKNRSGKIFQEMVALALDRKIKQLNLDLEIVEEDPSIKIRRNKKADFVIYHKNQPKIVIEVNFYGIGGSKPTETAGSYLDLNKRLKEKGLTFIWVTDGPAWKTMKQTLKQPFQELDYLINYNILNQKLGLIIKNET